MVLNLDLLKQFGPKIIVVLKIFTEVTDETSVGYIHLTKLISFVYMTVLTV